MHILINLPSSLLPVLKISKNLLAALAIITGISSGAYSQSGPERQWPGYRGYLASGVLDNANLPVDFNAATMKNIRWKTAIPGLGLSSPAIWNDMVFITTAVSKKDNSGLKPGIYGSVEPVSDSSEHEWQVICIDRLSGKQLWSRTAFRGIPSVKRHPKSSHANSSVATDGSHVVAFFGSEGLYCYDMKGKLLWSKNFGILRSAFFIMKEAEWEFASSPLIHDGVLIIQSDVLENSFLAAYDVSSGKELWKKTRDEYPGWCTPNVYTCNNRKIIAVNGYKHRGGYDIRTGEEIWKMSGGGDIQIPTPIIGKDLVYFNSAHGKSAPIIAVKKCAQGDITLKENESSNEHVRWSIPRGGSYMHTLLLYRNRLYNVDWNGIVTCYDPDTGARIYSSKLGNSRSFVASPVASDGKIYIVDEQGTVYIISDGDKFSLLAENQLNDNSLTAPALSDGIIIFRTQNHLIGAGLK